MKWVWRNFRDVTGLSVNPRHLPRQLHHQPANRIYPPSVKAPKRVGETDQTICPLVIISLTTFSSLNEKRL